LLRLPAVRTDLARLPESRLAELGGLVDPHEAITGRIGLALVDDPPATARDGGVIRAGYDDELDRVREAATGGKTWIAGLEAAERVRTGIRSLRVGFNKVFGYYLEVSNATRHLVPADYVRTQTLTNAERYIRLR
jgi:DNA mismatch repair protein MutS